MIRELPTHVATLCISRMMGKMKVEIPTWPIFNALCLFWISLYYGYTKLTSSDGCMVILWCIL